MLTEVACAFIHDIPSASSAGMWVTYLTGPLCLALDDVFIRLDGDLATTGSKAGTTSGSAEDSSGLDPVVLPDEAAWLRLCWVYVLGDREFVPLLEQHVFCVTFIFAILVVSAEFLLVKYRRRQVPPMMESSKKWRPDQAKLEEYKYWDLLRTVSSQRMQHIYVPGILYAYDRVSVYNIEGRRCCSG